MVCGQRNYDWPGLEKGAKYDGGFTEEHRTVKHFWSIFYALDDDQRKTLLEFCTGSDRCPVGGLERLKLTITKNGPDSNRLPSGTLNNDVKFNVNCSKFSTYMLQRIAVTRVQLKISAT